MLDRKKLCTLLVVAMVLTAVTTPLLNPPITTTYQTQRAPTTRRPVLPLPQTQWNRTYGGTGDDAAHSVQQTADGGYIVAGGTNSSGAGDYDFWLVKTDGSGNQQWNKTYGGTKYDMAASVQQTSDGGYILAGYTYSSGAGKADLWLVKTDSSGKEQWNKTYGRTDNDVAFSVQRTSDGGYITAGFTESFGIFPDFWLVKTDSTGTEQWNKTYNVGREICWARSVQQTSDYGYIVAGYEGPSVDFMRDFWLVKTDSTGTEQWNKTYGGTGDDAAHSVQQTADGGYIVAGQTYSFGAGDYDFWLVKTDGSGNQQWNKTYGGTGYDSAYSVQQTADGGYIVAGATKSFGAGMGDFWLINVGTASTAAAGLPIEIIVVVVVAAAVIGVVVLIAKRKKPNSATTRVDKGEGVSP